MMTFLGMVSLRDPKLQVFHDLQMRDKKVMILNHLVSNFTHFRDDVWANYHNS